MSQCKHSFSRILLIVPLVGISGVAFAAGSGNDALTNKLPLVKKDVAAFLNARQQTSKVTGKVVDTKGGASDWSKRGCERNNEWHDHGF